MENKEKQQKEEVIDNNEVINEDEVLEITEMAADELESDADKMADLEQKCKTLENDYLRLFAEFDNYRKRTLKEKSELIKSAGEKILINILPLVDDFERALKVMDETQNCDLQTFKEGINLIYSKFISFLNQNGVKAIDAEGKDFDTEFHEAVTTIPAPSEELKGKVVESIQKGYTLHDKVIRFSKVVIGE
ncbi:MAG: nucleotide exchange factor GrpE [Prevotellaceae bacterium]|jgi:molecular chaperone GrpE|nr:nucleotide exchange factor GrpE [Prevotellaceae bacterium]